MRIQTLFTQSYHFKLEMSFRPDRDYEEVITSIFLLKGLLLVVVFFTAYKRL